jgi:hypothetical protein
VDGGIQYPDPHPVHFPQRIDFPLHSIVECSTIFWSGLSASKRDPAKEIPLHWSAPVSPLRKYRGEQLTLAIGKAVNQPHKAVWRQTRFGVEKCFYCARVHPEIHVQFGCQDMGFCDKNQLQSTEAATNDLIPFWIGG